VIVKSTEFSKDPVVWEQAEHAAAAGCKRNSAFCYDLLDAIRESHAIGLDRPVFVTDLDMACTVRKYAPACQWRGVDVQAQDPARAAHYFATGCSGEVEEYSYSFPALPPHSAFRQTWPNTPAGCCVRLENLYGSHRLEPPSRDFIKGLRSRADDLQAAQHQQSQERQAADAAEDVRRSERFTEDLNKLSMLDQVAAGLAAVNQAAAARGATLTAPQAATHAPTTARTGAAQRTTANADETAADAPTGATRIPPPAPGPTPAARAAVETQSRLEACLAEPATKIRTAQTNPFQAYITEYETLLGAAANCGPSGATPGFPSPAWTACIGMNARLWPDYDAQRDYSDFLRRFGDVIGFLPPGDGASACNANGSLRDTRAYCTSMGKDPCMLQLRTDVTDMQCANEKLPHVWDGEIARKDSDAKKRHDDACHERWR